MRHGNASLVILAGACLMAQAIAAPRGALAAGFGSADRKFATEAAQGGQTEVALGKLAVSKASNPDVKEFGQRMVDDHSKANDELKSLAMSKSFALPSGIGSKNSAVVAKLSKLSGTAFDRAYMKDMVEDHVHDVAAFAKESKSAKDPDLKAWAGRTLPTLEDHLKMARAAAAK